jgi:hypothetical protein
MVTVGPTAMASFGVTAIGTNARQQLMAASTRVAVNGPVGDSLAEAVELTRRLELPTSARRWPT